MAERLSSDASIIQNPDFENGLIKIMDVQSVIMTVKERNATQCFFSSQVTKTGHSDSTEHSLAKRAFKRRRLSKSNYSDSRFVLPTSNICERIISKAGFVLNYRRKIVLPATFERNIFLHANSSLSNISDVHKILNSPWTNQTTRNYLFVAHWEAKLYILPLEYME